MNIAVAGTGYVGLSIATLLAQHNHVVAVDVIPEKVDKINKRIYSRNKLTEGTIVLVNKKETKNRVRKTENGFEDVPGVFDVWWTSYKEVDNL